MTEEGNAVSPPEARPAKEQLRSTRPRVNAVLCVILAVLLAGLSVLEFWYSTTAVAIVGPALATIILAILSALIALLAFRVARSESGNLPLAGPLQLFTILTIVVGVVGAALGFILGAITVSYIAVFAGVLVFALSITLAIQGALVYGAAKFRA